MLLGAFVSVLVVDLICVPVAWVNSDINYSLYCNLQTNSGCQRLEPTWELFARKVSSESLPVGIGKVDCVAHAQLCKDERILAFPTLRWYKNGKVVMPDYSGDRTVDALLNYVKKKMESDGGMRRGDDDDEVDAGEVHHPGCKFLILSLHLSFLNGSCAHSLNRFTPLCRHGRRENYGEPRPWQFSYPSQIRQPRIPLGNDQPNSSRQRLNLWIQRGPSRSFAPQYSVF